MSSSRQQTTAPPAAAPRPTSSRPSSSRRPMSAQQSSNGGGGGTNMNVSTRRMASFRRANSARRHTFTAAAVAAAAASDNTNNGGSDSNNLNKSKLMPIISSGPSDDHDDSGSIGLKTTPVETVILDESGHPVDSNITASAGGEGSAPISATDGAASKLSAMTLSENKNKSSNSNGNSSIVQAMSYRGMEVIFASSTTDDYVEQPCILIISSRTRMTLQSLKIPPIITDDDNNDDDDSDKEKKQEIVTMHANHMTGLLCVVMADKRVLTYYPIPALASASQKKSDDNVQEEKEEKLELEKEEEEENLDGDNWNSGTEEVKKDPTIDNDSNIQRPTSLFGKYTWVQGRSIQCASDLISSSLQFKRKTGSGSLLGRHNNNSRNRSPSKRNQSLSRETVNISSSMDHKVLITHADQMVIYDATPPLSSILPSAMSGDAALLWTTRLQCTITCAVISGDGRSIAFVLEGEGVDVPYPFGVRTLIRDKYDGAEGIGGLSPVRKRSASVSSSAEKNRSQSEDAKDAKSTSRQIGGIDPPPIPTQSIYTDCEDDIRGGGSSSRMVGKEVTATEHSSNTSVGRQSSDEFNIGILYKPGPFLVHSTTVTRLSFRGHGINNSEAQHNHYSVNKRQKVKETYRNDCGNDLLLSSCASDGSMRIFAQGSWKLQLHWDTPPGSRADWIQGITMCNLGDLDPFPKASKSSSSTTSSTNNNYSSRTNQATSNSTPFDDFNDFNQTLLKAAAFPSSGYNSNTASSGWQSHPMPNCAAGAWISELTFRGPFPALRLSRLSFLKSGGDAWAPAHFESVAAILPPATLYPHSVLQDWCGDEDLGMTVQGIWSAWNPWDVHPNASGRSGGEEDENISGSAFALLGAVPQGSLPANGGAGGAASSPMDPLALGGTHAPPSELRLVVRHPENYKVVLMEFPLWGDTEFGAMELGSPLRYCLQTKDDVPFDVRESSQKLLISGSEVQRIQNHAPLPITVSTRCACLEFESNGLYAVVSDDGKRIGLSWRKKATANIVEGSKKGRNSSAESMPGLSRSPSLESIATTASLDSRLSHISFHTEDYENGLDHFTDLSVCPLPLSLPQLLLPPSTASTEKISLLEWWPDENFGGPPRLFALTTLGTLIMYEMPSPWSAIEPVMPMDDPLILEASASDVDSNIDKQDSIEQFRANIEGSTSDDEERKEYEAHITPHPDFGLGLRLEAQADGMPAIAGSFKKHPLSGGRLPAEKLDTIVLGDELISVNGVSLEGRTFDDIISTVRFIGASSQGEALRMKFRRKDKKLNQSTASIADQGLEVIQRSKSDMAEIDSQAATIQVGADSEMQQEFGRVVAIVRNVLPKFTFSEGQSPRSMVLLPWFYGKGAPIPYTVRGATLLVTAVGRTIRASRLEILNGYEPEASARLTPLGSVALNSVKDADKAHIKSLKVIKMATEGWCVAACDSDGSVTLVFIDIDDSIKSNSDGESKDTDNDSNAVEYKANFRTNFIFNCNDSEEDAGTNVEQFLVRAPSIELLATMPVGRCSSSVSLWSSTPSIGTSKSDEESKPKQYYKKTSVTHRGNFDGDDEPILDFRWVASGSIDAFPWLVTFSNSSVVVHRRPGGSPNWIPVAEFGYPERHGSINSENYSVSSYNAPLCPSDAYPHLIPALRSIISTTDERKYLVSDWHPDSILASICTVDGGPKKAITSSVRPLIKWLSEWMDPNALTLDVTSRVACAPVTSILITTSDGEDYDAVCAPTENAESLMNAISEGQSEPPNEETTLLEKLLMSLSSILANNDDIANKKQTNLGTSQEFIDALSSETSEDDESQLEVPHPLKRCPRDDLCFIWTIGKLIQNPPNFKDLDEQSQFALFFISFMRTILKADYDDFEGSEQNQFTSGRAFLVKSASFNSASSIKKDKPITMPYAAALSALMSNTQTHLLKTCRKPDERMDWDRARGMHLAFWLRSDEELKKLSEEIAQTIYKSSRDVMECALFYCATGNIKMLRTIAATDSSTKGRMFFSFLNSHDFTSIRGKKTLEKNAYSLLRKRQYSTSAAFFLLARPPMLKTALEIIVSQMEDFDLAFFVSRLVEANISSSVSVASDGLTIGGGFSLSSMGGGGGFAGMGAAIHEQSVIEQQYQDWKPELKPFSHELLASRGLSMSSGNPVLQSIILQWLHRPNDSAMCMVGRSFSNEREYSDDDQEESFPTIANSMYSSNSTESISAINRVMLKTSSFVDFSSRPFLIKVMNAPDHIEWSSALQVSRLLNRRGIELSSVTVLPHESSLNLGNKSKATTSSIPVNMDIESPKKQPSTTINNGTSNGISSIFDSFDTTPVVKNNGMMSKVSTQKVSNSSQMDSSIFDTFDKPVQKLKPSSEGTIQSSIFDNFDAPPPTQKPAVQATPAAMESSIFDNFDAPPPPKKVFEQKPAVQATSAAMESSIFDNFDAPPPPKKVPEQKPAVQATSAAMESSIFDTFSSGAPQVASKEANRNSPDSSKIIEDKCKDSELFDIPVPAIWLEWRRNELTVSAARRLLREMARVLDSFEGDSILPPSKLFRRHIHPLVAYSASHILQDNCEGEAIISLIYEALDKLCSTYNIAKDPVIEQALLLLACPSQPHRIVYAVLLHCLTGRADLAEDIMRDAAHDQIQRCDLFTMSNDELFHARKTKFHISSQYVRRHAAMISWQLELCLWLQRGGAFPMSGLALKEAIIAVRIGLLVASWGRNYECLESILKCEPDCKMDFERGRQLWSSMKVMLNTGGKSDFSESGAETTSGGWEFLVDCNRAEATDILRKRKAGNFLLRPHPDDHGVFTLSFRTNLDLQENGSPSKDGDDIIKPTKSEDVVQHAIVRLSDVGFRCGSFGPFSSLLKLLEAVSSSLPFDLRFSDPPVQGIIKEEGEQPSPNAVFIRKLALNSKTEYYRWNNSTKKFKEEEGSAKKDKEHASEEIGPGSSAQDSSLDKEFGIFSQLLTLTELRKQFCAIVAADDPSHSSSLSWNDDDISTHDETGKRKPNIPMSESKLDLYFEGSLAGSTEEMGEEEMEAIASRTIRPFLSWCRAFEIAIVPEILPSLSEIPQRRVFGFSSRDRSGDAIIRRMIQPKSGVEFRTLRVGEGGNSAVIVLFSRSEAISWIVSRGSEKNEEDAGAWLDSIERKRIIEQIDLKVLSGGRTSIRDGEEEGEGEELLEEIRYRFVDPWEAEVIDSKDAELRAASLGREHYVPFTIGAVARACEHSQRSLGGLHLLALWSAAKGGFCLTKALASAHAPWERDCGGDLTVSNSYVLQPSTYDNSIREHLYRNAMFRRLGLPQRFLAHIQVELLDLKNLTSPGGSPSLTAYGLLRLKRTMSKAPLTHKARTLDSACTEPKKISKSSGPNAPASWGSLVRFRFPLPEDVSSDGTSFCADREALFKGAPCVLQMSVYEKRFMNDVTLGGADIKLDTLSDGGQVEEWVPLRSAKSSGITWFARIRLTLRFELMCLESKIEKSKEELEDQCPSAGLRKIRVLSRIGGAQEDTKSVHRSLSTPEFVNYLESIVT